jgi:hypothetical protein
MEFKSEIDVRIAEKMVRFRLLGEQIAGNWNVRLTSEFHMTNDSGLFRQEPGRNRVPLMEGKMIQQFNSAFSSPRYWIVEKEGREAILGERLDSGQLLDYQGYRLAFRDVASNTNERTMIATVVSSGFLGNTLPAVSPRCDDMTALISNSQQVFLCAVFNSFALDWLVRAKVTSHLNFFAVYQLPIPRLTEHDAQFEPIVSRAARLLCTSVEFDDLARQLGLSSHADGEVDPVGRARIRAELDGIIANLYRLTEEEFAYILTTFPVVLRETKDAALAAFKEFAPKSIDQQIAALISAGESSIVEFKSSVRWDMRENRPNEALKYSVIKTVAAFLNSNGGTLLVGVDDERKVVGLKGDYSQFKRPDSRDAFENWLSTQLIEQFGKPASSFYSVSFHAVEDQDVCRIEAKASPSPVYVDEKSGKPVQLYIRTGNASRALETREIIEYSRHRWPTG